MASSFSSTAAGRNGRYSRLAGATERRIALMNVHFDGRAFGKAHHFIVWEVLLHDGAMIDGDLIVQRRAEAKKREGESDLSRFVRTC